MKNTDEPPNHKEYLWKCLCHDAHFLQFSWWPDDDFTDQGLGIEGYLSVTGNVWSSWKTRIKKAWEVLHTGHTSWAEMEVNMDNAEELRRCLDLYLADAHASKVRREKKNG